MNTRRFHKTALASSVAALLAHVPATAEELNQTPDQQSIESVVVVGQTTNTVVEPEELEKYLANDLSDVFRRVPSVSVGGSLGIAQKIYIRGMEDTLLNVTVDGAPQTTTLFHHVGRVSIDPSLLKEVEVQAGAGEATAGAGAIGGAIRFKTKDVDDLLTAGEDFGGQVNAGYFSNDGYTGSATFYGNLSDNWGVLGSYVYVDRENMEDGDGNELYGTAAEQSLFFTKLSGQLSDNQHLTLSFESRDEEGDFGARPNWPVLEGETLYPGDAERTTLVANHSWHYSELVNLQSTLYYTDQELVMDRFDRWGRYSGEVETIGFDVRNTSEIGQHTVTYGVEHRDDTVKSRYLDEGWQDWAWDPDVGKFKEEGEVTGIYAQDHWQITPSLLLSVGVRYDEYELDQVTYDDSTDSDGVSANIGFEYQIDANWRVNAGYAEAMRGKEVGDAFTLEHAPGSISIAPDLDAEEVDNLEVGVEYVGESLWFTAAYYDMEIDDVIMDQIGQGVYYENVGKFESDGFEVAMGYNFEQLHLTASYAENDAELNGNPVEGYEHNGLANARGDTWLLTLDYEWSDQLEMGWSVNYVEALDNIEVLHRALELGWIDSVQTVDKPSYAVHDMYVQWVPLVDESVLINFSVANVFDKHYRDHSSVADYNHIPYWDGVAGLYEAGRDIRFSATYQF
ncbi:TonB-dependent receptor [Neiella marina]|uniref:TonB-dependent receptor n=1 Tax=Neiella holothuriorum TaxID=2870530 RepID=A0ABS7EE70_9GAMM|nr:TonB-dependent receptor [Neiella holothuriorum]MBW8190618.1 TonB-dependent receptor [Neiella holothuriorum]